MYAISLTSIPPRLSRIGPVIESLLAQRPSPDMVCLSLPKVWARFGAWDAPLNLPDGVFIHSSDVDYGPAQKVILFAIDPPISVNRLIYCDDDWIYPQGWAEALWNAGRPGEAVAASGFSVRRLKRRGGSETEAHVDIAQGFAGVCIDPEWLRLPDIAPPPEAAFADDIWLSGQMARQGISIRHCPEARAGLRPAFEDGHGLQDLDAPGQARAEVYHAALEELTRRYGIWPAV